MCRRGGGGGPVRDLLSCCVEGLAKDTGGGGRGGVNAAGFGSGHIWLSRKDDVQGREAV